MPLQGRVDVGHEDPHEDGGGQHGDQEDGTKDDADGLPHTAALSGLFPVLALCSVFFGWLSLFIDRAPSFLCYWCMRRTDRGMDEKTFYSIIKPLYHTCQLLKIVI